MNTLVRAELLKLRTTRTIYSLTAGMAVSVALSVAGGVVGAGKNGEPALDTAAGVAGGCFRRSRPRSWPWWPASC